MFISHIQIVINFYKPTHPPIHDCDAVGGEFYYLVFSSLVKQNKKAKICFVIHIAGQKNYYFIFTL